MKKILYSGALILSLCLTACSNTENYSPQEILDQTMQETSEISTYYGEYVMDMGDGKPTTFKHWEKDGKRRIEMTEDNGAKTIVVNDGRMVTSYNIQDKTAMRFSVTDQDGQSFVPPSLKEQAQSMLKLVQDTHDISVGKEEKIAGHNTYHLIAKAKDEKSLIGDLEIWVDKKTWVTLKSISTSEDLTLTTEYTVFDPEYKVEDQLFTIELPEDVIVQQEEMIAMKESTIEEAKQKLGDFLVMKEQDGIQLGGITDLNTEERPEFALNYLKDGVPAFTLSIFKPTGSVADINSNTEEGITIRGQKGAKMEAGNFRFLQWDEGEHRYGIILENPDMTFEEVIKLTEQMEIAQ